MITYIGLSAGDYQRAFLFTETGSFLREATEFEFFTLRQCLRALTEALPAVCT